MPIKNEDLTIIDFKALIDARALLEQGERNFCFSRDVNKYFGTGLTPDEAYYKLKEEDQNVR